MKLITGEIIASDTSDEKDAADKAVSDAEDEVDRLEVIA